MLFCQHNQDQPIRHFNFTKSGAGGDRIYALPLVRSLGGGILHGIPESQINFFKKQPYIFDATVKHEFKRRGALLLWGYSVLGRYNRKIKCIRSQETLIESHFLVHNLPVPTLEQINDKIIPWLTSEKLNYTIPIVVHRTSRYRDNNVDWSFLKKFRGQIVCIGFKKEAQPFVDNFNATWMKAHDLTELTTIINSAQVYIGNQSMPLSLAVGLGKTRLIEECKDISISIKKNTHYTRGLLQAVAYYQSLGNIYPMANCTFGSPNEFVMTSSFEENYLAVKRYLSNDWCPKLYE